MKLDTIIATQTHTKFSRSLLAGGPGSGRHPYGAYNKAVNTEHPFHQTLMQHGFSHAGSASRTHYYTGNQATRNPATLSNGKPTQWTIGHGVAISTRNGKPSWFDQGDMNRSGNDAASLEQHLGKVGYSKQF